MLAPWPVAMHTDTVIVCHGCGAEVSEWAAHCGRCGAEITDDADSAASAGATAAGAPARRGNVLTHLRGPAPQVSHGDDLYVRAHAAPLCSSAG